MMLGVDRTRTRAEHTADGIVQTPGTSERRLESMRLFLMHGVARYAWRHTRSRQAPCSAEHAEDSAVQVELGMLLTYCTVLHCDCSLRVRRLPAASTAPARNTAVPTRHVFEHVQIHCNGWVYYFAWFHSRSNWILLYKGYIFFKYIFLYK